MDAKKVGESLRLVVSQGEDGSVNRTVFGFAQQDAEEEI